MSDTIEAQKRVLKNIEEIITGLQDDSCDLEIGLRGGVISKMEDLKKFMLDFQASQPNPR